MEIFCNIFFTVEQMCSCLLKVLIKKKLWPQASEYDLKTLPLNSHLPFGVREASL